MLEPMAFLIRAAVIGLGATAFLDLTAVARNRLGGVPLPDYSLVGRWIAFMPRGRFIHRPIAASAPIRGERAIGWFAHYLTGVMFAGVLLAIGGADWARHPTPGLAFGVGLGSIAAPFLLMQPGMGAGVAAARTPRPAVARLRSVITHAIFGVGLYAAAWAATLPHLYQERM
jgi:hypothetical protein